MRFFDFFFTSTHETHPSLSARLETRDNTRLRSCSDALPNTPVSKPPPLRVRPFSDVQFSDLLQAVQQSLHVTSPGREGTSTCEKMQIMEDDTEGDTQ